MSIDPLQGLQPQRLWELFQQLLRIPRPSKHEDAVMLFLERWAAQHGYTVKRDDVGNRCIHVPATPGGETGLPVVLQSHVDIVAATDASAPVPADAAKAVIPLDRVHVTESGFVVAADGGWLRAPYTTLGADNGIGCAMMLAVCEDASLKRPPLELLFTVDEEEGLTGALQMDAGQLGITGKTLLNLDTEDDDELTIGCAGGRDTEIIWTRPQTSVEPGWAAFRLEIGGLRGGHSGMEINAGRANAIRVLAQFLETAAQQGVDYRVATIDGGDRRNAIPRSSAATVFVPGAKADAFRQAIDQARAQLSDQFAGRDNEADVSLRPSADTSAGTAAQAFSLADSQTLIRSLLSLPAGVVSMTPEIPALPESSNNLAVVTTTGSSVKIACNSRSSTSPAMEDVSWTIRSICGLAGAEAKTTNGYPGWKPNLHSPILQLTAALYRELFASEPKIHAVHAGLECGVLSARVAGGLDAVSFGPNIKGNHAPGERVEIRSVQKSYRLLTATLARLAGGDRA
jgi:dipeptidase D